MIYARGKVGILGAVAGATLFCVMMVPLSSAGRVVRTTLLALFGLLIAFLILLNLPGKPLHSLTTGDTALRHVAEHMSRLTDFGEGSGRVRVLLGEATRDALESRPAAWVLGVGPDGAWGALAPFDRPERETIEGQGTAQDRPHQFLYEKLLSGGLLYCAAWLGLLALGVGAACRRLGYFKSSGTAALAIAAGAAAGFVFCIIATGSLALAGGASLLAACGAAGILLCVRRFRLRDADLATAGDPVWIGIVCALCAHFAAGSFSVSMAPERTLAFALAAAALFAASHGKGRNSGASGDAPDRDGLLLGAAALATLPLYVYYGFRWEQAPRPVYAAAIVPVYLLFSALLSFRAQWKRRLVEAAVVYLLGFSIFGLCRWLTPAEPVDALVDHRGMAAFLPAILALLLILLALHVWGRENGSGGASLRQRAAAAFLVLFGGVFCWISHAELKGDTTFFAAVWMSDWSAKLYDHYRAMDDGRAKQQLGEFLLDINAKANAMVPVAREEMAPLKLLGAPSAVDRQPEKFRPK
jgi:hypothetical protein